jgi:hypothetical protein
LSSSDNVGGEGFQVAEGAAGGQAGFFEERRVQDKGAAIDEGVIRGFERLAGPARKVCAGDEFFVHLQVGLKFKRDSHIPMLVTIQASEKSLTKGSGFLAGHGPGFGGVDFGSTAGDEFQGAGGDGEQCFALEKIQEIAVEAGMDLEGVATVLDDVGINEAGNAAFAEDSLAELLGEGGGEVAGGRLGF